MDEASTPIKPCQAKVTFPFICMGLVLLAIDQLSKWWVFTHLPVIDSFSYWYPYGGIPVFKDLGGIEFSINYMTNTGAAWGILGNYQNALIVLRIGLIIGLICYLFLINSHPSWRFPLVLIITGALGNVIDFFLYGHVVDMLHFVLWGFDFPVFNIADSAISIGIVILFALSYKHGDVEAEK